MLKKLIVMIVVVSAMSGCVLAPIFDSVHKAGVTENDRKSLLGDAVKRFHEGLMWGDPMTSLAYVEPENFEKIKNDIRDTQRKEKIVSSSLDSVDFKEDAFYADVEVGIKHYEVPYYVVQERRELQKWHFSMSSGWKLQSREVLKTNG